MQVLCFLCMWFCSLACRGAAPHWIHPIPTTLWCGSVGSTLRAPRSGPFSGRTYLTTESLEFTSRCAAASPKAWLTLVARVEPVRTDVTWEEPVQDMYDWRRRRRLIDLAWSNGSGTGDLYGEEENCLWLEVITRAVLETWIYLQGLVSDKVLHCTALSQFVLLHNEGLTRYGCTSRYMLQVRLCLWYKQRNAGERALDSFNQDAAMHAAATALLFWGGVWWCRVLC
jgi:hypothetical protein